MKPDLRSRAGARARLALLAAACLMSGTAHAAGGDAVPGVDTMALVKLTGGLLLVLGVIIALSWLLRRAGRYSPLGAGQLRVLGGVSVGARERVALVQVGETQIVIGVAPGRVQMLHVLDRPLDPAAPQSIARDPARAAEAPFAARLRELMGGRN